MRAWRAEAAGRLEARELPTPALEEWRYSRIDRLDLGRYRSVTAPPAPGTVAVPAADDLIAAVDGPVTVIDIVDGWPVGLRGVDKAVSVDLAPPEPGSLGTVAGEPDYFATLNAALTPSPVRVRISRGAASRPVVIAHRFVTDGIAACPRVLVEVADGAEATVVEVLAGPGEVLAIPVTELQVADGARLSYLQAQWLSDRAWQIALQSSRVGRGASLLSATAAFGGDYARLRTDSRLAGPGGTTKLLALYFGTESQMHDFRTLQAHSSPKTQSDLLYKGVVANEAHSVYSGLIRVDKGAGGTNAFQTNRNLVLNEGAHADSVPNLEIEDNDVRCSHASAVGPVSEDERFYLESRGIPPAVAERLIALGFLREVVEQLPVDSLRPLVGAALVTKLAQAEQAVRARPGAGR